MKILQVFGELGCAGAESRMMDVYKNIDRKKYHFDFLSLSTNDNQFFEKEIISLGGKIYKIKSPRDCGFIKHINDVRKIIKNGNYNAVHAHTSFHSGIIMLCAWLEHIPVRITHARTNRSKKKGLLQNISIIIGKILIKLFATHRIAISTASGIFLFGNSNFEVIPNSFDLEKYLNTDIKQVEKLRKELNIDKDSFIIGHVGRFEEPKNHKFLVYLFKEYLKINPNSKLILVGDSYLKPETENLCKELNIFDNVIFTGIRNDVNVIMRLFDVFVFPSLYEGLGTVILEAQASGIPCVKSEGVPDDTDLGLKMVQSLSLKDPIEKWIKAITESQNKEIPDKICILNAFENRNYTLKSTIEKFINIYNKENIIEKKY